MGTLVWIVKDFGGRSALLKSQFDFHLDLPKP